MDYLGLELVHFSELEWRECMKWRDYRSNSGMVLAGMYLFSCIRVLVTFVDNPPYYAEKLFIGFLYVTLPFGTILVFMFLDVARPENGVYISLILIFIGVVVNTLMFYFIGYLLTRLLMFIRKSIAWRDYKSRTGIVLAGLYVLLLMWFLVEVFTNASDGMPLLISTMPGSIALGIIFYFTGLSVKSKRSIDLVCAFVGGTANTLGLYLLGYLLTRMFGFLKRAVWKR